MKEAKGNIFEQVHADAVCITTNELSLLKVVVPASVQVIQASIH